MTGVTGSREKVSPAVLPEVIRTLTGRQRELFCRWMRFGAVDYSGKCFLQLEPELLDHNTLSEEASAIYQQNIIIVEEIFIKGEGFENRSATAGSDVVQSGRPIFDDFFQHLWPYIGNNTANVVFQMVKRLWLIRIDQ
ncbi:hypothetical protein TNCV_1934721 [Trichonephila clavipes]|nr:hypothetical protein TNCV_1934721 [Trichonephila clavipes]